MKNALLLAGSELRAYARSPIGYVVAAVTLLGEGIYFYAMGLKGTLLSAQVLALFFEAASGGTMVMAAILAMRLIAGERENGLLQLQPLGREVMNEARRERNDLESNDA